MNSLIDEFLSSCSFAATTKRTYSHILRDLETKPDLETWTGPDLLRFIEREEWGNARRCVALAACCHYLRWRFGMQHAALSMKIKRLGSKRQRVLSADKALELLASFDTYKTKGSRDLAIAALALDTGLRCAELCRLRTEDVDLERRTLQVICKGGRWAWAVFSPETAQYIQEWNAQRAGRGDMQFLFVSTRTWSGLKAGGLAKIMGCWGENLNIKLSPHDLRRSFATLSTIYGAPSRVVQLAGRWSNIGMVERYTRELQITAISPYFPVSNLGQGSAQSRRENK